ncbi:cytochrome P450 6k1-like, partial [Myzus persicae]|uniref:cytochrome P450 6k1-like n=1 Tax=Myzus persicae TaxID=13164 RepID=UPI000B93126F
MMLFLPDWFLDNFTFLSLIAVFVSFYYYSTSTYGKWQKLNIPYLPPVPLFGNTFRMMLNLEHPIDTFERFYYSFPDAKVFGFYQMREPMLLVRDPELINRILVNDFSYFTDHGMDMDPSSTVVANSLFFTNGKKWRTMRQQLSPGFTSGKLKDAYFQINECGNEMVSGLVEKLGKTNIIEVKTMTDGFSTDVIGTCAFGLKLDAIKNDESDFRRYIRLFFHSSWKQMIFRVMAMTSPWVNKLLKLQMFSEEATNFFYKVFTDVVNYREKHNVVRNDLAQTLMQARKELVLNPTSE